MAAKWRLEIYLKRGAEYRTITLDFMDREHIDSQAVFAASSNFGSKRLIEFTYGDVQK